MLSSASDSSPHQIKYYCHVLFEIAGTQNTGIHFTELHIYSICPSFLAWMTMYFSYNREHQQIVLQSVTHSQEGEIGNSLHWRTVIKHLEYYSTSRLYMIWLVAFYNNDFLKISLPTRGLCNKLMFVLTPDYLMHVCLWSRVSLICFINYTVLNYFHPK